jgi:hypothetical protein
MSDAAPVGAGEAPKPVPPAPDGPLAIRGGVGGVSFQLEELLRGASQLDDLVQQLLRIEEETRRVQDDLEPFLYDSYGSGCEAINAVADSRKAVGRVRQELVDVSSDVRASHRDYVEAEAKAALPRILSIDEMRLSSPLWPPGREMTSDLASAIVPFWLGTRGAVRNVLESPFGPDMRPRPVSVERTTETVENVEPTMGASLRRLEQLHARGDGEIEVIRLGNNGQTTWMVLIPGTQPDSAVTNPFDMQGIGEGLGYDSEAIIPAVSQALREAGAGTGDQVVAVGHSQGGIHAMNLGQNKAFLSEFDLKYVLTAGAPVGGITAEPGISSLHLEHAQDWVPGTDGRMNPDTKDRVTVTLNNEVRTPEGEGLGLGPGHNQEYYAEGADLVGASHDASLMASTAVFAGVVGAGGAAKVTRYKLTRAPLPLPSSDINPDAPPTVREAKTAAGAR